MLRETRCTATNMKRLIQLFGKDSHGFLCRLSELIGKLWQTNRRVNDAVLLS